MSRLVYNLLGPPRVELDGEELHIPRRKAVALLAYLAVEPSRHSRDVLATLLWSDYDQSGARGRLRRTLSTLNRTLGGVWLTVDRDRVGVNPNSGLWLDVDQFRQRLTLCETHGHPIDQPCPDCSARLTEAAKLYRGDFMSGFTLPDSLDFDEWQRHQTERLRDELASVLERLAAGHGSRDDYEPAVAYARRCLELDPLRERAHQQLMELYARAGRRSAALRQYRACMRVLEQELDVPPSAETTALYDRIRSERTRPAPAQVGAPPPPGPERPLPAFLSDEAALPVAERPTFVARERELVRLDGYLEQALIGQGQVVFVSGGPGRGKTVLMQEFARRATAKSANLLIPSGACHAYSGAGDPYHTFRQVLAMLTGDVEGRWAAGVISTEHAKRLWDILPLAVQTLFDHDPHLIDIFVSGQALLSRAVIAAPEGAAWLERLREWVKRERGESTDLKPQYLFEQYTNALCDLALEYPLVLILDDLQWIDGPSASLLFHLGRHLAEQGGRVLIVGAYRPEEVALGRNEKQHPLEPVIGEFKRRFGDVQVDLTQADQETGRRFVDALLDCEPNRLGQHFREKLHTRTGGHPLFTVELLRTMQERGDLTQDDGAWIEMPTLNWGTLPARVEAVIEARLSRLNEDLCDILRVASVEGEVFTAQAIALVQDLPLRQVLRVLSGDLGASGHRLVRESGEVRVDGRFLPQYQFAHALFQAYVYKSLGIGERRLLHGEVGATLEGLYGVHSDEIAVPLAYHFTEAGQTAKAAEYLVRVGDLARRAYANPEAAGYYQQALALLGPSADFRAEERTNRWKLDALAGLGKVYLVSGNVAKAEEYLRDAVTLGKKIKLAPRQLVRLYWWLSEALFWQSKCECLRIGEEGLALLEEEESPGESLPLVETALMNQVICAHFRHHVPEHEQARKFHLRNVALLPRLPYREELRAPYINVVGRYDSPGKDAEKALEWCHALVNQATRRHDLRGLGDAHRQAGEILWGKGELREAALRLTMALEIFEKIGDVIHQARCLRNLALLYLLLGDLKEAQARATQGLRIIRATEDRVILPEVLQSVGVTALCRRDAEKAVEALERATTLFGDIQHVPGEVVSTLQLGHAYLYLHQQEEAQRCFQQAAVAAVDPLCESPRMPRLGSSLAHALSGLAATYQQSEPLRAFCQRLREDETLVRDPNFTHWYLEPAEPEKSYETPLVNERFAGTLSAEWSWQDSFGDCFHTLKNDLEIRAVNGRELWLGNLSAPRLLRPVPQGARWAVQTVCIPMSSSRDRPVIGGLLLWKDKKDFLRLDLGSMGANMLSFLGCVDNQDLIVGRGRLTAPESRNGRILLRMDRIEDRVHAFCSINGAEWFTVGSIRFPTSPRLKIGLVAFGMTYPWLYPGAFAVGTAIRFESFTLWG
jgi:DNA-binding SARP family transcriptional activator